ncbi:MAG: amino acid adenylation domain-containing protein [Solirubrobacteraceae bacterium]
MSVRSSIAEPTDGGAVDEVRQLVTEATGLDLAVVDRDEDLVSQGVDSIAIMTLVARWRERGVEVRFADLAQQPTLGAWSALAAAGGGATEAGGGATEAGGGPAGAGGSEPALDADGHGFDEHAPFALATLQLAYWVGRAPGQPLGAPAHFYAELDGRGVSGERLERATRRLIERHAMLRVRFRSDGLQQIDAESSWDGVRVHDLRRRHEDECARELDRLRDALSHRRLDVEHGEVFALELSLLAGGRTRLHVDIDMLVADAQSFRILLSELAREYTSDGYGPVEPVGERRGAYSFPRYLHDKRARAGAVRERARAYWQERLATLPGPPQLPLAADPSEISDPRTTRRFHRLAPEQAAAIASGAREVGVTPAMAFIAAFAEVLGTWSAQPRFLLNLPLYDRAPLHRSVQGLVGDFTTVVLLEVDCEPQRSFAAFAQALQTQLRNDACHSEYTGVEVLRDLARGGSGEPVGAPVVFTSAISLGELFDEAVRAAFGEPVWTSSQTPQVWLDCQVTEREHGLYVNWDVIEELFAPGVLDAMWEAFVGLVDRLADPGAADWADVGPLIPAGQLAIRAAANATAGPLPARGLHEAFFAGADARAAVPALMTAEQMVTHGELRDRALAVARGLRERGVTPGEAVGVSLPKGPDQVVAVLGVLAAGAAYVPISIDQPALRRDRIVSSAGIGVVIDDLDAIAGSDPARSWKLPPADPDAIAYVLYTSGSTGEPKGVEVTHRAALNTIDAIVDRWAIGAADRCLAVSALDFDLSVLDVFGLLGVGGAVVMPTEAERRDAAAWSGLVSRHRVTIVNCAPALLQMLTEAADTADHALAALRLVLLGGDWVALDLPRRVRALAPGCRFVALGGTTETAIHSTVCEVKGEIPPHWRSIPYGVPLRNQLLRVVDRRGRDCPDWVPGELWIGGLSVARGYRGDPERTRRQFVTHAGHRFYRTGDLARYWPDGTVEFLGRADHQIKLRGHRIELGEIETALEAHPEVARAVAVLISDGAAPRLAIGYCTGSATEPAGPEPETLRAEPETLRAQPETLRAEPETLRAFLRERVPAYMVPEQLERFVGLPLSANGKIDRRAIAQRLAATHGGRPSSAPVLPASEVERAVAATWAELLGLDAGASPICREDSFFALGGDSLVATRLLARLSAAGIAGATLRDLFAKPVLREFCAGLTLCAPAAVRRAPLRLDPEHRHEPFGPTDVQRAYWLGRRAEFSLGGVGSHWYWEFDGAEIDLNRLETALNRLVERHEMLRAVFDADGRQRIQVSVPHVSVRVRDAAPEDETAALAELRGSLAYHRFDPERWPLFEVEAVRYGGHVRIGFGFDYIVLDALSIMIVFSELGRLYADPDCELAPLELSFRDYVLGVKPEPLALERAQEHWLGRLDALAPSPELPLAVDPATVTGGRFTRRHGRLTVAQWATVVRRGREHGLTPSSLLAAAYAHVLAAWSARPSLTLNLTLFDRREVHEDAYRILGDFTSLLLVSHECREHDSWLDAARRLQTEVWEGMAHRDVSAVWVIRELARALRSPDVSMPVVFTSALGVLPDSFDLSQPFGELVWGLSQTPQVWLDCQVMEQRGELLYNWDAVEELFAPGVLDAMFGAFEALLAWLSQPGSDWCAAAPDVVPGAQRAVRERVNSVRAPLPDHGLHERFFAHAQTRGERPAILTADGAAVGHASLAERSLRVAALLVARGLEAGEPVMVTLPKGVEQIIAVLGVLAAGGAYVPVGVEQPPARRARIASSAGARFAVLGGEPCELPSSVAALRLSEAALEAPLAQPAPTDPDSLAYIIYTSGSTGEPKGVMMTHRGALNTIDALNRELAIGPEDRVPALSALDFDLSVYDVFGLLAGGGALIVPDEARRLEPRHWLELMHRHRATVWNSVPALLDMLLVVNAGRPLPRWMRVFLVSGDWVGLDLPDRAHAAAPRSRFIALGGATEAGIWSNWEEVERVETDWRSIPYGVPLPNQRFRVVDACGRDCPDWVPGELWIGGDSVALGYRGDADRSRRQFVTHAGHRFYRTGDLGRYRPDGRIEFLGRRDHQVKLRGHRIELGEIEAALEAHPAIRRAVATVRDGQSRRLIAFARPRADEPDADQVMTFLRDRLPAYMVPEELHWLDELPLTVNGKIDRAAIERIAVAGGGDEHEPPVGLLELELAELFADLLGLETTVSRRANFFALGGDSLLATRALEALRRRHGIELSLRALFAAPTVHELGRTISDALDAGGEPVEEGIV